MWDGDQAKIDAIHYGHVLQNPFNPTLSIFSQIVGCPPWFLAHTKLFNIRDNCSRVNNVLLIRRFVLASREIDFASEYLLGVNRSRI